MFQFLFTSWSPQFPLAFLNYLLLFLYIVLVHTFGTLRCVWALFDFLLLPICDLEDISCAATATVKQCHECCHLVCLESQLTPKASWSPISQCKVHHFLGIYNTITPFISQVKHIWVKCSEPLLLKYKNITVPEQL